MNMIEAEESSISAIRSDLQILMNKVDRMESMMQSLMEIYTDLFYTAKDEYIKEIESIDSESEFIEFSDFEELKRSVEES